MEQIARVAGMADTIDPTASDPAKDVELGQQYTEHQNHSRASLPHFRQRSQSNATEDFLGQANSRSRQGSVANDLQQYAASQPDSNFETVEQAPGEIPWGPEHPCYPHLNPHVPLSSPQYLSTRIIRVRRDWMVAGDLAPTFKNIYPEILEPYLSETSFRALVAHVNAALVAAFNPKDAHNWLDASLGLLTGWLWDDLGFTAIKGRLTVLEAWIEDWNRTVGAQSDVMAISLRRTGYSSLDLQIPDPPLGPDVPRSTSRPGSIHTIGSAWSNTTASRSQLAMAAGKNDAQTQPEVPPIPAEYLQEANRIGQTGLAGVL